ncbi:hypothetical protein JZ751_020441 [Albula glossodonta]|uniref:Uncharacterized protein n=1 Tax=Albula glossodonta TaxID=121402 RepID=A0A8T2MTL9_9TELE|nr:hypothetical protein JZ751_020441 [Albula glossodonta]
MFLHDAQREGGNALPINIHALWFTASPLSSLKYVNHTANVRRTNSKRSLNCFRIFFTGKRSILAGPSPAHPREDS